jgi:hypothetical protein
VRLRLYEPAVALTDLAIGVEAALFALILARDRSADDLRTPRQIALRRWFVVFFGTTGLAALVGAVLHGLLPPGDRDAPARRWAWRMSLGSIGVAGLSSWWLAALLALPRSGVRRVGLASTAAHGAYLAALSRTNPPYSVAVATYLPGAIALGAALARRSRDPVTRGPARIALGGLALTLAAAIIQVRRIGLHPRLFDHNATYHATQAIAVACFFGAARRFIAAAGHHPPGDAGR